MTMKMQMTKVRVGRRIKGGRDSPPLDLGYSCHSIYLSICVSVCVVQVNTALYMKENIFFFF